MRRRSQRRIESKSKKRTCPVVGDWRTPGWRLFSHLNAAGIDVGNESHYVAIRPDRDPEPVRRFACFTADLYRMAEWLPSCGVKTIAMQSTGVYWIPL